ncbi:MAG: hypothetical protein AAGD06_27050 [Acidobacteriota bacterium]
MSKMFSLLFAGFLFIGLAGEVEGEEIERAFTPTKSLDEIHGVLTTPEGDEFSFAVRSGQWLRIERLDTPGQALGYVFRSSGDDTESLVVHEYLISEFREGEQVSYTGEDYELSLAATATSRRALTNAGYELEVQRFEARGEIDVSDPSLTEFELRYGTRDVCCVVCNGYRICGCRVTSSTCGATCCAGSCCGGGGEPTISNRH